MARSIEGEARRQAASTTPRPGRPLAKIRARRRAELAFEHGGEGAGVGVAEVEGDIHDFHAAGQLFQRHDEPGLLAPLAEGHAGLAGEAALDGFRVDAQAGRPLRKGG